MARPRMNIAGNRYGKILVIDEAEMRNGLRYWNCVCDCGVHKIIYQSSLVRNVTTSCGCGIREKMVAGLMTKDGRTKSNPQLYKRWMLMKRRANNRDECLVCEDWLDYFAFERWSLYNGYSPELHLCRNGDVGNYEPDNCRWDTAQSNMEEAHAKIYKIISPDGNIVSVYNLRQFCIEKELGLRRMRDIVSASPKRKSYMGWKPYNQNT